MPVSISRCEKSTSRILDASQSAMPADAKSMAREYGIHIRTWKHDIFFTLEFNDEIWITWITRLSRRFFRSCSSRPTSQRWLYFPCIYRVFWINLFPFVSAVYIYIYIYIHIYAFSCSQFLSLLRVGDIQTEIWKAFPERDSQGIIQSLQHRDFPSDSDQFVAIDVMRVNSRYLYYYLCVCIFAISLTCRHCCETSRKRCFFLE